MRRECVMQRPAGLTIETILLVALGTLAGCARPAGNTETQASTPPAATTAAAQGASATAGPPTGVTTFATPEEAVDALVAAGGKQDDTALAAFQGEVEPACNFFPYFILVRVVAQAIEHFDQRPQTWW